MATINHPTYSCDKCGKVFEKRIKVRHSWPKILPYAMDRANYCDVRFTLDIWYGGSTPDPDLCPDCIREVLLGALEDLDGQTPKEDTVRDFAKDMFDQYRRLTSEGKETPEILAFASDFFHGLIDGSVRIDKPEKAKEAIREFAGTICARLSGLAAAGKTAEEMMDGVKALLSEAIAASICRADGERLAEHFAEKGADGIIAEAAGEVYPGSFSTFFIPNTEESRRNLSEGETYLTVFRNASKACESIYRGNDSWMNPETGKACTNEVAYFSTARVFDMAGFPGWKGGKR